MKYEVKVPVVGESINEVTIGQWLKNDGDYVEMDDILCEIESEKATLEIRSEQDGELRILISEGETIAIGTKIGEIDGTGKKPVETGEEGKPEVTIQEVTSVDDSKPVDEKQVKVSPVAARMLSESGIQAAGVQGTGAGGRITKADVQKVVESSAQAGETRVEEKESGAEPVVTPAVAKPEANVQLSMQPESGIGRTENRVKMSTLRKTIARRLVAAKNETAMLTTFNELDMSNILELRSRYKELFLKKYELKLGFMSFFIKAACMALQEFPEVNARLEEDEIIYHDYCDVSIAVSTPKGLVVPVIFDADRLNLPQIEAKVDYLANRARDNKLTIEEMTGGTFSITNGGVFGSLLSTPIINAPQTAILGMHKIEERPIAMNGEVVIRPMMYLALSYDHRIIDGKESVNFLVRVKELLEDPSRILLDI
jgi:2-oxoglutarate dehydrogenase E2 component (dihydrolipoamide succinyltransferase)